LSDVLLFVLKITYFTFVLLLMKFHWKVLPFKLMDLATLGQYKNYFTGARSFSLRACSTTPSSFYTFLLESAGYLVLLKKFDCHNLDPQSTSSLKIRQLDYFCCELFQLFKPGSI
jgi:hypothetical protein